MSRKNRSEVLIAGAGPAGLAAALSLRARQVDVEIVDPRTEASDDAFAVVLHRDSLQRLAQAGVLFDLQHEVGQIGQISIYDRAQGRAEAALAGQPPGFETAASVPHWLLCKQLEAALHGAGTKVRWNHRVARVEPASDSMHAYVESLDYDTVGYAVLVSERVVSGTAHRTPPYLIAADGRESLVRNQLRAGWRTIGEAATVADFEVDLDGVAAHEMQIVVGDAAMVTWPLPGHGLRITFHLPPDALPDLEEPGIDDLGALLRAHAYGREPAVRALRRARVTRVAPAVVEPPTLRAVFVGDAAHVLPAAASQELNQSLGEAQRLAGAIHDALRDHSSAPVAGYAAEVRAAAAASIDLGAGYRPARHAEPFVAEAYRRILPLIPARGPDLDDVARQLGLVAAPGAVEDVQL